MGESSFQRSFSAFKRTAAALNKSNLAACSEIHETTIQTVRIIAESRALIRTVEAILKRRAAQLIASGIAEITAARSMPQPCSLDRSIVPALRTRYCRSCGEPMFLMTIEPSGGTRMDEHTFECAGCNYAETELVRF